MKCLLTFFMLWIVFWGYATPKDVVIQKIQEKVVLDGELSESFWKDCAILSDFIQNTPIASNASNRKTNVRLAYDNSAIYIAAEMFDQRDSMSLSLSERDDFGNADFFGLVFDPYNAGTIGFAFYITSAGVQIDELHEVNSIDENWNAVWKSEVTVKDDRWIAEIKIPFSALRFPKKEIQTWGVNFIRNIRRDRELSHWNFYDPKSINLISQMGVLNGISGVESPLRLSLTPYVSGYIENFDDNTGTTVIGGLDLKYGLNDAFTIDMTLIPDFGQVQFDNQVLNLSPFEVRFNENRQFFTEGVELFDKQGLFYTRRVGGTPVNIDLVSNQIDSLEEITNNPKTTQLINATKLSGRTKKGTGIGVFNAVTKKVEATIQNKETGLERIIETSPATNYNVFVIDQNLKNNSTITLTNTNVLRNGHTYDANVTALGTNLYTKGQKYRARGLVAISQIYKNDTVNIGHKASFNLSKSSGNFLGGLLYKESSKSYNQNDLGFQRNNNIRNFEMTVMYNKFVPFWRFYKVRSGLEFFYSRLVSPNVYSDFVVSGYVNGTFRNFMTVGAFVNSAPVKNKDWFEPRINGRFYEADQNVRAGGFMSSDYSKSFAVDFFSSFNSYKEDNRYDFNMNISPRFRFNDRFLMIYANSIDYSKNNEGVALTQNYVVPMVDGNPIFAKRDRFTVVNRITANYIFTNRMGLTFDMRHYWSKVTYNSFYALTANGQFAETVYTGLNTAGNSIHNNSFNAFTIDMAYRWVFAPGSELSLVWKNSIFNSSEVVSSGYFNNLEDLFDFPSTNSISLKILYYIDFWEAKQKLFYP